MFGKKRWTREAALGALGLVALSTAPALAATRYVDLNAPSSGICSISEAPCYAKCSIQTCISPNDGSSWTKAYRTVQEALTVANSGDDIWVAAGTYKPAARTNPSDARSVTFKMKAGVDLYGGFDTGDTLLSHRDPAQCSGGTNNGKPCAVSADCSGGSCAGNVTILSGDLDSNDNATAACSPDDEDVDTIDEGCNSGEICAGGVCIIGNNAYHVVTYDLDNISESTTLADRVKLDGFVIRYGKSDVGTNPQGAAVHIRKDGQECIDGGPVLTNCLIEKNFGTHHGAVNDHACNTIIENCVFRGNRTTEEGGAFLTHSGSPTLTDCLFEGNEVTGGGGEGGAVWAGHDGDDDAEDAGSPDTDTTCQDSQGNIDSAPTFRDCTFKGNKVTSIGAGGAVFTKGSSPSIASCLFEENFVYGGTLKGGALWIEMPPVPASVKNTQFIRNECIGADGWGGAFQARNADVNFVNCEFKGNIASAVGGAAAIWVQSQSAGTTSFVNCSFVGNEVGANYVATIERGGVIFAYQSNTAVELTNCTVTANRATAPSGGIVSFDGAQITIKNSILWANEDGGVYDTSTEVIGFPTGAIDVYSSIVDTTDPVFAADPCDGGDAWGNSNDNYGNLSLDDSSPAKNTGNDSYVPLDDLDVDDDNYTAEWLPIDLDGTLRQNGAVDKGAHEVGCNSTADCDAQGGCHPVTSCTAGYCVYGTPAADGTTCATGVCLSYRCVECYNNGHCATGETCNACNVCVTP